MSEARAEMLVMLPPSRRASRSRNFFPSSKLKSGWSNRRKKRTGDRTARDLT
jgi:hypothetical protein